MSKKDKQKPEQPSTPAVSEEQYLESLERTAARTNEVLDLRAEIDRLKAEMTKALASEANLREQHDQLEAVRRRLEQTCDAERQRADGAEAQRKALRSDLMVLEQTAAGRAPDIALQTDLGKSAGHALSEVLTMLDKMNEDHLQGDALPVNGWASTTARQLVESVGPQPGLRASDARSLLLGDLLAQLLPHTGEAGQNETASDVLKRICADVGVLRGALAEAGKVVDHRKAEYEALSERMVKIQSAMVARRAPDAEWFGVRDQIASYLKAAGQDVGSFGIVRCAEAMSKELVGLRAFFSEAPLTAVAVRDDGATGPVRERFSLLVLTWDGKAVSMRYVEENRPWGDISPYLEQTTRKHLIPAAYR